MTDLIIHTFSVSHNPAIRFYMFFSPDLNFVALIQQHFTHLFALVKCFYSCCPRLPQTPPHSSALIFYRFNSSPPLSCFFFFMSPRYFLSSVQHVDIAALLIKYNTCVNATDKWAFTPLHEAAQKGRTQLCALLLAHGADPTMKNQEGQTPLDLATV